MVLLSVLSVSVRLIVDKSIFFNTFLRFCDSNVAEKVRFQCDRAEDIQSLRN